jgi:hypothetical protein
MLGLYRAMFRSQEEECGSRLGKVIGDRERFRRGGLIEPKHRHIAADVPPDHRGPMQFLAVQSHVDAPAIERNAVRRRHHVACVFDHDPAAPARQHRDDGCSHLGL